MLVKPVLLSALLAMTGAAETTSSKSTEATVTATKTATSTHKNVAPMMTADAAAIGLGAIGIAALGLL